MFNPRLIKIESFDIGKEEIRKINVEDISVNIMVPKSIHLKIKVDNLPCYAANIIKQHLLSNGGEAVVSKNAVRCSEKYSDVLIMGTWKQIYSLTKILRIQPKSLKILGLELERILKGFKNSKPHNYKTNKHILPLGEKTYIMGILNITPDSFSDGGNYININAAVSRALEMIEEGADIIDIGGESTRPGHTPIDPKEEMKRVIPVIKALSSQISLPISIDTSKAIVARAAMEAGANIINDVWGFQKDPDLIKVAKEYMAGIFGMHNNENNEYNNIIGHIIDYLDKTIEIAKSNNIDDEYIGLDPGIGFGKNPIQNLEVMNRLDELRILNYPILLGTSRKSLIGHVLNVPSSERLEGSLSTAVIGITKGIDFLRVHDIKETSKVVKMADAIIRRKYG